MAENYSHGDNRSGLFAASAGVSTDESAAANLINKMQTSVVSTLSKVANGPAATPEAKECAKNSEDAIEDIRRLFYNQEEQKVEQKTNGLRPGMGM